MMRIPAYWQYWLPMLRFLHNNINEVIVLAPKHTAEVVNLWLRRGGENWLLRKEAAEIGLAAAERILQLTRDGSYIEDDHEEAIYTAALAGAKELPDRMASFVLDASGDPPARSRRAW